MLKKKKKRSNPPKKQKFRETHNLWPNDPRERTSINYTLSYCCVSFRATMGTHTPPLNIRGEHASPYQEPVQSYRAGYKTILLRYNERENILSLLLN